jgi:hypothetical protein
MTEELCDNCGRMTEPFSRLKVKSNIRRKYKFCPDCTFAIEKIIKEGFEYAEPK